MTQIADPPATPEPKGPSRTTRARSQRAVRNDLRLAAAAIAELQDSGFDGLQMGAVASRAGLSSGAVYNRFENVAELAVTLWQESLRDRAFEMFDRMLEVTGQTFGEPFPPDLIADISNPSPEWRGALDLMLVARRVEELNEVISEDLRSWQARHGFVLEEDPIRYARGMCSLSPMIGLSVLRMLPSPVVLATEQILRIHQGILNAPWEYTEAPVLEPTSNELGFSIDVPTGDPVGDALISAAAGVIANSGFVRSTVSRIARRAGFTTAAIYERYENKDALIMDTVNRALTHHLLVTGNHNAHIVIHKNFRWLIPMTISQSLHPTRTVRRRLRQELTLAGIHNPAIGAAVSDACAANLEEVLRMVAPVRGRQDTFPEMIAGYIRSSVTGRDMLADLDPELWRADFRPYTDYLLDRALGVSA